MKKKIIASLVAISLAATGCANMTETQKGTAKGAGIGAGIGAVLGAATGGGGGERAAKGAAIGAAAGAIAGNVWSRRMEAQKREMEQATAGTGVQVSQTEDNRLKLQIPSDISFDTNRANIKSNFRPILDKFAASLQENPNTRVQIIGHTDNTGTASVNDPLSLDRAAETRDYLASKGISSSRIMIDGRGEREPIASNADPSGRARNRRVEIYVAEPTAQR